MIQINTGEHTHSPPSHSPHPPLDQWSLAARGAHTRPSTRRQRKGGNTGADLPPVYKPCTENQFTLIAQSRSELVHLPSEVVYTVYSAVHTPVYSQTGFKIHRRTFVQRSTITGLHTLYTTQKYTVHLVLADAQRSSSGSNRYTYK